MIVGVYPGSFDPITFGHVDLIRRSLRIVDKLIVAIGINTDKIGLLDPEERKSLILDILPESLSAEEFAKIQICNFSGLLVEFARNNNVNMIIRGIRALSDFDFEFSMAGANYKLCDTIETVFLVADEKMQFISSRVVKDILKFNGDASKFVPEKVITVLKKKFA